jgi:hypothetical protein
MNERENVQQRVNIKCSSEFPKLGQDPNDMSPKYTNLIDFGPVDEPKQS